MTRIVLLAGVLAASIASCGGGGDGKGTGAVEVVGAFSGDATPGASVPIVITGCPLEMPPEYSGSGTIAGGQAQGIVDGIPAGGWCVLTYVDMDPEDGLMPVVGLDATMVLPAGDQSIPVTVTAGKTATVTVDFEVAGDDTDTGTGTDDAGPGTDDVWVRLTVACDACTTSAPVIFYGYAGDTPGTIPDIYNKITGGVAFPLTVELDETGAASVGPFVAGPFIVAAYQDLDDAGMGPEDGEPISAYASVELVAGAWNEIALALETSK